MLPPRHRIPTTPRKTSDLVVDTSISIGRTQTPSPPLRDGLAALAFPPTAMSTWPFHRLNELPASIDSPFGEYSPLSSGGFDDTLSTGVPTPLSGFALDAHLEAWKNVEFTFDGADFAGASMGYDGFFPAQEEEGGECVGEERGRYLGRDRESMVKGGNRDGSFQGLPARESHGGGQYPYGVEDLGMMSYVDQVLVVADGIAKTSPLGAASSSPSPSLSPPETDLPFVAPTSTWGKRRHTSDTSFESSVEESPSPLILDTSPKSDKRARNTAASGASLVIPFLPLRVLICFLRFFFAFSPLPYEEEAAGGGPRVQPPGVGGARCRGGGRSRHA